MLIFTTMKINKVINFQSNHHRYQYQNQESSKKNQHKEFDNEVKTF
jgi:hypothetical protein